MKDLDAFEVLLDVPEFKRWTLQMKKTIIFCKDATKTYNPYANIIILVNEFVVGLPS